MKRAAQYIIVSILCFSVILCSSFSASAYYPIFSLDSSEWTVASEQVYSATYPINSVMDGLHESVFQHEELNGMTYYMSKHWDDGYQVLKETEFYFPAYPISDYDSNVVVRIGDSYYLICGFDGYVSIYSDSESLYYYSTLEQIFYIYKLSYPFTEWSLYATVDAAEILYNYTKFDLPLSDNGLEIIYSSVDVLNYENQQDILHGADTYVLQDKKQIIEYYGNMSVLTGSLTCNIDAETYERLSHTVSALLFNDIGFVIGTDTDFLDIQYILTVRQNGEHKGSAAFMHYNYDKLGEELYLPVGEKYFDDIVQVLDYSTEDLTDSGIDLVFTFSFVSNGYNLFFPGTIELVEYASYEESEQHKEVINTIQSGFDTIMNNKIGLEEVVIDTSPIDDYVADQEEIIDGIYSDTDEIINDNLPEGYEDENAYLEDNISYFNQHLSDTFYFVKTLFDRLVDVTGVSYLILFCLSFGFAIFVMGRRLR